MFVFCHSRYFSVTHIHFRTLVLSSDVVCCRFCGFYSFLRRAGKSFGLCGKNVAGMTGSEFVDTQVPADVPWPGYPRRGRAECGSWDF